MEREGLEGRHKGLNISGLSCEGIRRLNVPWEHLIIVRQYLHDPDNHDGVITHLEPDILECEVKWALGSITMNKASGGDGIPVELFQILKKWCCGSAALNMPVNLENSAMAIGLGKVCFHSNPKERQCQRMFKLQHNCTYLTCKQSNAQNPPCQASTVHEPWTSRCSSWILKRQRNQRSNCQHPLDHQKSKRVSEKHLLLLYWLCQSLWLCGSQQLWKFLKGWEFQTTWPISWRICMEVNKQQLELHMEQQTGSKSGKE